MKSGALHKTRLLWVSEIISKNIHSDNHDFSMSSKMLMRIEHDANDVEWMEYKMGVHDETSCWGIMEFYNSIKYRLLPFRASSLHISFECILWAFLSIKVLENDVNEWKSSTDFGYTHTKYIFPTEKKLFRLRTEHEDSTKESLQGTTVIHSREEIFFILASKEMRWGKNQHVFCILNGA